MPEPLPPTPENDGPPTVGRSFCRRLAPPAPTPTPPGNEAEGPLLMEPLDLFAEIDAQLENLMLAGSLIVLRAVIDRDPEGRRVCLECRSASGGYDPILHAEGCTVGLWLGLFDLVTKLLRAQPRAVAVPIGAGLDGGIASAAAGYDRPPDDAASVAPEETASPRFLPEYVETYAVVYDKPTHLVDVRA